MADFARDFLIDKEGLLEGYSGGGGDVIIPTGVRIIGEGVFRGRDDIISVTIPEGVIVILEKAFAECVGLKRVTFPEGLDAICEEAFAGCVSLSEACLPESLLIIENNAFEGCVSLEGVDIPYGIEVVGPYAFAGSGLRRLSIPAHGRFLMRGAFSGCFGLANSNGFIIVNGILYGYNGKNESVVIPRDVEEIDEFAFSKSKICSVSFPETLTVIGRSAFEGCENLGKILFSPRSRVRIRDSAFRGCTSLGSVTFPERGASLGFGAFSGCGELVILGKEESVEKYSKEGDTPFKAP